MEMISNISHHIGHHIGDHPLIAGAVGSAVALTSLFRVYDGCRLNVKPTDLHGKVVVITGGNRGIGKETVRHLAKNNATIIIGCRDVDSGQQVIEELKRGDAAGNGELFVFKLDLSSFKSVREFADRVTALNKPISYLINNAGMAEYTKKRTPDNNGWMYQVNHLSHFLLTNLLLDNIIKAAAFGDEGRIINLSSGAHELGVVDFKELERGDVRGDFRGYCDTKLLNILFSNELNRRLAGKNVISVALHPGIVGTDFLATSPFYLKYGFGALCLLVGRNERQGSMTSLYTVYQPNLEGGRYYDSCRLGKTSKIANDQNVWKRFWELSERQTGIKSK